MRSNCFYLCLTFLAGLVIACNLSAQIPATVSPSAGAATVTVAGSVPVVSTSTSAPRQASTPSASPTASIPSDVIVVDTFDQETYPFKQDSNCSLGEAIWAVLTYKQVDGCIVPSGSTTIYLPTGTYTLTDADNSPVFYPGNPAFPDRLGPASPDRMHLVPVGFPVIFGKITILGNGSTIQRTGPNKFSIFKTFIHGDLTLRDLTITGGDTTGPGNADSQAAGGALQLDSGTTVTLTHVTLTGNQSGHSGSGGAMEISVGTTVTIEDSVIQGNSATGDGGDGGGINNGGTLILKNSLVAGNVAPNDGGGIRNENIGQLTLDHSRIEGNSALLGGGIYNDGGVVNITNGSMIAANLASEANNVHGGGGINNIGTKAQLTVSDSFILGNHAEKTAGGGIYNQATLMITHSVLAYNISGGGGALFNDVEGKGSISNSCILQNKVVDVTPAGLGSGVESGSDNPFEAAKNWWGAADGPGPTGPGSGDSVTRNVTFDDFLKVPPDICATVIPTPAVTPVAP